MPKYLTCSVSVLLLQCLALPFIYADVEPNNFSTQSNSLILSRPTTGTLTSQSADIDWYSLSLNADTTVSFDLTTTTAPNERRGELQFSVIRKSDGYLLGDYSMGPSSSLVSTQLTIERSDEYLLSIRNSNVLNTNLAYELQANVQLKNQTTKANQLSGLWRVGDAGYASIHQLGTQLDVVVMGYSDAAGYRWETLSGLINDKAAKIKTTIGYVSMEIDALFPTPTTAEFTVQSCATIIEGNPCRFRPGITFFLEKIIN